MVIYGRNPVREAFRGRRKVLRVWATRATERESWLSEALRDSAVDLTRAEPDEVEALAATREHQGVCAEVEPYPYANARQLYAPDDALVIVLDEIQDPHNVGALARVAECAGASGLVLPERRSAEITPAVCKASAGAVEHLPVARVPTVADYLAGAKQAGAWIYGAAGEADTLYDAPDYRGKVVLVMGSEGKGLRQRVADSCDALIRLPMAGKIQSLNVATAGAVLIYEILQNRLQRQGPS